MVRGALSRAVMKPNRLRIKTRLAVRHARSIRLGIRDLVDIDQILNAWFGLHHPELSQQTTVSGFQGRDWARMYISVRDTDRLYEALGRLYADAYIYSIDMTSYELARAVGLKKALSMSQEQLQSALKTQWDNWRPGNRAAAALLEPPDGLRRLLAQRNLTIRGLASTTIDRIGTRLADGLRAGLTRDQVARSINEVLNDATRSVTIAQTEMSRAITQANQQIYTEAGVTMYEYLVVEPCDECRENLKNSPQPADGDWPNGEPPVHPNCMCELVPYITMEVPDTGVTQEADILPITPASIPELMNLPTEGNVTTDYSNLKAIPESDLLNVERQQSNKGFKLDSLTVNESSNLAEYKGESYRSINNYLRNPEKLSQEKRNLLENQVVSIDKVFEKAPPLDDTILTYRGVTGSYVSQLQDMAVGSIFREPAYASTSLTPRIPLNFVTGSDKETNLILEIVNPKGTKGIFVEPLIGGFNKEWEWLLPRNTEFRIIEKRGNVIMVEVVK